MCLNHPQQQLLPLPPAILPHRPIAQLTKNSMYTKRRLSDSTTSHIVLFVVGVSWTIKGRFTKANEESQGTIQLNRVDRLLTVRVG